MILMKLLEYCLIVKFDTKYNLVAKNVNLYEAYMKNPRKYDFFLKKKTFHKEKCLRSKNWSECEKKGNNCEEHGKFTF
jgi:hypothetical protein